MPIAREVHNALFEGKSVQRCLIDLLSRESKDELADYPGLGRTDPRWRPRVTDEAGGYAWADGARIHGCRRWRSRSSRRSARSRSRRCTRASSSVT